MKFVLLSCLMGLACISAENIPVILCGRQLANARVLLCYGAESFNKRGSHSSWLELVADDKINEIDSPWSGRRGALSAGWSRYKRNGLVDECCLKPCTEEIILSYC